MPIETPAGPIGQLSVREQTYQLLKKQLLTGYFNPSERLTEQALAKSLGVSRTPVREALHKLELEGLVKAAGARGFCVPEETVEEMNELFEIRSILEGHALACLCKTITEENIDSLRELVARAEQALVEGKLEIVFDCNTRFHDLLYGLIASGKPRLYGLIEDMRNYILRYRHNALIHQKGAGRSVAGHKKILLALELRDADLCERIMRAHIGEAQEDALSAEQ